MKSLTNTITNKLERVLISFIPLMVKWEEYWQPKVRQYKHQELKNKLKSIGYGVRFKHQIRIEHPQNVCLGNKIYIGTDVLLDGRGGITIGDNTTIGFNTIILSANHDYQSNALPYEHDVYIHKPVVIGRNVWIGANVLIIPGIVIGDGAIIAAGTVITSNVEPLAIVGGQPHRIIKYRDKEHYERLAQEQLSQIEVLSTTTVEG